MKRLPVYIILIIAVSLVSGCDILGSSGDPAAQSYLPLSPGNTWTYAVYDSLAIGKDSVSQAHDTVRVSVLRTTNTSGKVQSLWSFKYSQHTDTMTISIHSDTLRCVLWPVLGHPLTLVYPFSVGSKWMEGEDASYSVTSKDTVTWQGGVFNNSYHIIVIPRTPNDYGSTNYWIEPDVGIVKINSLGAVTVDDFVDRQTWTLLSYKINK